MTTIDNDREQLSLAAEALLAIAKALPGVERISVRASDKTVMLSMKSEESALAMCERFGVNHPHLYEGSVCHSQEVGGVTVCIYGPNEKPKPLDPVKLSSAFAKADAALGGGS